MDLSGAIGAVGATVAALKRSGMDKPEIERAVRAWLEDNEAADRHRGITTYDIENHRVFSVVQPSDEASGGLITDATLPEKPPLGTVDLAGGDFPAPRLVVCYLLPAAERIRAKYPEKYGPVPCYALIFLPGEHLQFIDIQRQLSRAAAALERRLVEDGF